MVYVHIPFCKQLCAYCDFYFTVSLNRRAQMVQALLREMDVREKEFIAGEHAALNTLYFGGGTPSVLEPHELQQLIEKVKKLCAVKEFEELTVEINPDDATPEYLQQIRDMGVNRLSIGVQLFDDALLRLLRRRHTAAQARDSVRRARAAGFCNITIDLMYGLPQQTLAGWQRALEQALKLDVPHISAYHLTIEPKTLFGRQQAKGQLLLPPEEESVAQFRYLHDTLVQAGYEHYEVSNFARPGFRAVHNSGYWKGFCYLGIGPSAHSYNGRSRRWNVANNLRYLQAIEANEPFSESEELTAEMRFNEYLLLSLRTAEGADLEYITKKFGEPFLQYVLQQAQQYLCAGTLVKTANLLQIPPPQFLLSDQVIRGLFVG